MTTPIKQCEYSECNNELKGRKPRFCSDKCRMAQTRTDKSNKPEQPKANKGVTSDWHTPKGRAICASLLEQLDVLPANPEGVTSMTKDQLYSAIRSYPQDTWVNSPEHTELMRRLRSMSIEQLEAGGYWIPCWKHVEAA